MTLPHVPEEALEVALARAAANTSVEGLPRLLGLLVEAEEHVRLRLRALPALATGNGRPAEGAESEFRLTPQEAADIVDGVSARWVLRHTKGLSFRKDYSRKVVRFQEAGLRRWTSRRRP